MIKIDLDTIIALRRAKLDEEIAVCGECGSPRLEKKVWVDYNTNEISDDISETEVYCETCEEHINVLNIQTLEEWKHKDMVYSTREKAIEDLAINENDTLCHDDFIDILVNGCPG